LKNNKFKYLIGTSVSSFGDALQLICITWFLITITKSSFAVGLLLAINYVPSVLLSLWAGVLIDSKDAKKLTVITDLIRAGLVMTLSIVVYLDLHTVYIIYIIQFGLSICKVFYKPASQTLIKQAFKKEEFVGVISISTSAVWISAVIGAGLAGVLLDMSSIAICFFINALTFIISATCSYKLRILESKPVKGKKVQFKQDILETFTYIKTDYNLLRFIYLFMVSTTCIQVFNTVLPSYSLNIDKTSTTYAIFDIIFTLGGVLTGTYLSKMKKKYSDKELLRFSTIGIFIGYLVLSIIHVKILSMFALFILGCSSMVSLVMTNSLIQIHAPTEMMGRISSVRSLLAASFNIISALIAGSVVSLTSANMAFLLYGIISFAVSTLILIQKDFMSESFPAQEESLKKGM